jgi:hypothetical protein
LKYIFLIFIKFIGVFNIITIISTPIIDKLSVKYYNNKLYETTHGILFIYSFLSIIVTLLSLLFVFIYRKEYKSTLVFIANIVLLIANTIVYVKYLYDYYLPIFYF